MFFTETGDAMRISSGGVPFCSGVAGIGIGEGCLREEESSDDDMETRTLCSSNFLVTEWSRFDAHGPALWPR